MKQIWRELNGRERTRYVCASTNCDNLAANHLVSEGNKGSYYCLSCTDRKRERAASQLCDSLPHGEPISADI